MSPATPQPVATGVDTYYIQRDEDFVRRHPLAAKPTCYVEYGDRCLRQFRAAQSELSAHGQQWLEATLRLLQEAIEAKRRADPEAFDQLERTSDEFSDFAFSTHSQAYLDGGILTLPADDLWCVLKTPRLTDLVSPDGIAEILDVLAHADRDDVANIVKATSVAECSIDALGPIARLRRKAHSLWSARSGA